MVVFDGLVLAGGRATRLGGVDKPSLPVGGQPMLARALAALQEARAVTVVGPGGDVVEEPRGGGPVAAIAAGLVRVTAPIVVVLAADLPFVTAAVVRELVAQAPAVGLDDDGREQYLLAAYPTELLRKALPPVLSGARMRDVVAQFPVTRMTLAGNPPPWWDCDTEQELAQAQAWA
jgi:molybdopterin-guanine dinucleotide biosynthesis protein A